MLNYLFLILLGLVIPTLAWMGRRQIAAGTELPRAAVYGQALASQAFIGIFAFLVAWRSHTSLRHWFHLDRDPRLAAIALLLLVIALFAMLIGLRVVSPIEQRIYEMLAPATRRELLQWVAICAVVAVVEEFVYRAVLVDVLQQFSDDPRFIIFTAAIIFGLAHLLQGPKGFFLTALFAVPLHLLVYLGGTLTHVIAIHFIYDVLAGLAIRRRLARSAKSEVLD